MPTVVVVDPRPLTRTGIRVALESAGLDVVVADDDGRAVIERHHPDVVVAGAPADAGVRAVVGVARRRGTPVIALVGVDDVPSWQMAIGDDCDAVLPETVGATELVDAIGTVASGGRLVHAAISDRLLPGSGAPLVVGRSLSDREHAVLARLAEGLTNDQIAAELGVAPSTVKTYVARVFDKLGTNDRAHAVARAFRSGLLR